MDHVNCTTLEEYRGRFHISSCSGARFNFLDDWVTGLKPKPVMTRPTSWRSLNGVVHGAGDGTGWEYEGLVCGVEQIKEEVVR